MTFCTCTGNQSLNSALKAHAHTHTHTHMHTQATGTIKLFPTDPLRLKMKNEFVALNNKVMELRKVTRGSHKHAVVCAYSHGLSGCVHAHMCVLSLQPRSAASWFQAPAPAHTHTHITHMPTLPNFPPPYTRRCATTRCCPSPRICRKGLLCWSNVAKWRCWIGCW